MNNKILSVSIAAYNVEKYLDKTLLSLVESDDIVKKLDVIIVDDGSIDGTAKIANRYVDLYPYSFRLVKKENGGYGSTLNTSVQLAVGKYFKMLDGDDWYDGEQLAELIEKLEKSDEDVIVSPYKRVYQGSHRSEVINRHRIEPEVRYEEEENLDNIHAAELTVRTALLQNNSFHITEKCAFTDDEYVFLVMLYASSYKKVLSTVYQYRIGVEGQTVSEGGRRVHWLDAGKVALSMLQRLEEARETIEIPDKKISFLYRFIQGTVDFQCDNYTYAENMNLCEQRFVEFSHMLYTIDDKFESYLLQESDNYRWWKWIFSVCNQNREKTFVVFGAGKYGEKICRCLMDKHIRLCGIVDNNPTLWGTEKWNVPVCQPQILEEHWSTCSVIVSVKNHSQEIMKQLARMGVSSDRIIAFRK